MAIIDGTPFNDVLFGDDADDLITAGDGNDRVYGGNGTDIVSGGAHADVLYGGDGQDVQFGDVGDDQVLGELADDTLDGGAGNDLVDGGAGNDLIQGEAGADLMVGGLGADTFRLDDGHTGAGLAPRDRVAGFSRSQGDRLDVELIDANLNAAGDQDFVFRGTNAFTGIGQIRVVSSGADRIIQLNNDSDLQADLEIVLVGFGTAVQAGAFGDL